MPEIIQIAILLGTVAAVVLLVLMLGRLRVDSPEAAERVLREELRAGRGESQETAQKLREENQQAPRKRRGVLTRRPPARSTSRASSSGPRGHGGTASWPIESDGREEATHGLLG